MSIYKLINLIFPDDDLSKIKLFDYQKSLLADFVTFVKPVVITVWADICDHATQSPNLAQGGDPIKSDSLASTEDPFAAEDKFEAPAEVVVFKGQPPQEIIEGWCLKIHPWYISKTKIGVGVLDNRKFDPKFIKETARKNRFKRLRLVKRKIDENKSSSIGYRRSGR